MTPLTWPPRRFPDNKSRLTSASDQEGNYANSKVEGSG